MRAFIYFIIFIVFVAIVAGFFVAGTPSDARLRKFDSVRIRDLQFIQSAVVNYWANKDQLPRELGQLRDDITGIDVPIDPQTKESYGYNVKGDLDFEICATFAVASAENLEPGFVPVPIDREAFIGSFSWEHNAGDFCFSRTIDPDIHKEQNLNLLKRVPSLR